jgi:hypothetical protein
MMIKRPTTRSARAQSPPATSIATQAVFVQRVLPFESLHVLKPVPGVVTEPRDPRVPDTK